MELNRWSGLALIAGFSLILGCGSTPADATPEKENESATVSLFDGRTLAGWEGEAGYWSVEDGAITGVTTEATQAGGPTYLIWRGGDVDNFELRFRYRLIGEANSGMQYRSRDEGNFLVHGYQADIESGQQWNGVLVEMGGRLHLAMRGQQVRVTSDGKIEIAGSTGDPDELQSFVKTGDWNEFEIIANGPRLVHKIDGHTMIDALDEDSEKALSSGILAIQLNRSRPMKVQVKDIQLKRL